MDWPLIAVLVSFATALYIHMNHVFQVDGLQLVHLRAIFMTVLPGIGLLFFPWPHDPVLYGCAAAVGVLTTFADKALLNAAAKYGGRLTSLFISIKIALVFILWSLWSPKDFTPYLEQPLILAGLLGCYALMVFSMMKMRRNDASFGALVAIFPPAILLGVCDIFSKEALTGQDFWGATLMFMVFVSIVQWVTSGALLLCAKSSWKDVYAMPQIKGSAAVSLFFFLMVFLFLMGVTMSPNPAYISAISVMSTAWLTIYYKMTKGDDASLLASAGLVVAAIFLTLIAM